MEHHPQFKCEIAVSKTICDLLLCLRLFHLGQDILEFLHMHRIAALHITDMENLRRSLCIRTFIELLWTLLHLCFYRYVILSALSLIDLIPEPFQIPLLCFTLNCKDKFLCVKLFIIHPQPPHFLR